MNLQVSKKGNRVGRETDSGKKLSFDMRNHHIYFGREKIAKYENGNISIINDDKVTENDLRNEINELMDDIIEG